MTDLTSAAGPSQPKKQKINDIGIDAKILQLSEKNAFSFYESTNDEDYGWDSRSESEGDSDIAMDTVETVYSETDSETEDNTAPQQLSVIRGSSLVDWETGSNCMVFHPFTKTESLLIQPTECTPFGYFRLFLTNEFLQKIVEETNHYAIEMLHSDKTKEKSRITSWKDLEVDEFLVFLGVFLQMGNVKMNRFQDYWKKDPLFHNTGIANCISRNRFLLILHALYFVKDTAPGEPQPTDKLYKIRPIIDFFNKRMCEVYYPNRELCLDEPLVLWGGRLFHQYIKNKKHKCGIKLYFLSTSSGVVQKIAIHTGLLDDYRWKNHAHKIVLHLLNEKLNVGHHVFMDSYYNSFDLAKLLLDKKTHCTGTLRMTRKNIPKDVQTTKLQKGNTVERYCHGVMIGKWKDKHEECYISTEYKNEMVKVSNKRNEIKQEPLPLIIYNAFMSRVGRQDQMLSYYLSERKSLQWYKKLFIHVIEVIVINSHALYNKYSGSKISLYDYRLNIIKSLLPSMEEQKSAPKNLKHILSKRELPPGKTKVQRKRCKSCSYQGKRTDTTYVCYDCPDQPGYCLNCCEIYHK